MKKNVNELWRLYSEDPSYKDDLVISCLPLVRTVAKSVAATLPDHIDLDDLVSEGTFGLLDAIEKYDSVGYKFETYAVLRIRGAIFDSLRVADWVPRSFRAKIKEYVVAKDVLFFNLGRDPSEEELADFLEWDVAELRKVSSDYSLSVVGNLDQTVNNDEDTPRADLLHDKSVPEPSTDFSDLYRRLSDGMTHLSEQQRVVLSLYYLENLSLREIGDVLGVTESRASQIHSRGLDALRQVCADPLMGSSRES